MTPKRAQWAIVLRDGRNRTMLYGPMSAEELADLEPLLEQSGFQGSWAIRQLHSPTILERLAKQAIAIERKRVAA